MISKKDIWCHIAKCADETAFKVSLELDIVHVIKKVGIPDDEVVAILDEMKTALLDHIYGGEKDKKSMH